MAGNREPGDPGVDPQPSDDPQDDIEEFDIPEDGNELDESELEPEEEELAPEPEPEPRRLTRRERQSENWRERAIRAEERASAYERQQQLRAPAPVDLQVVAQQRAQEYERISMLPGHEQVQAIHQLIQRENAITQLNVFDQQDRRDFNRLQDTLPSAKRLAGRVEEVLQQQRAAGVYSFSREQIYDYLIGNEIRTRGTNGATRQRREGAARVARETTRPSRGGRGDVAGGGRRRGRTQDEIDRDLLNTPIRDTM